MNSAQMLITIAALLLLSMVVLNVNKNFLTTNSSLLTNKQTLSATSVATSIIEEATGKAFDENTVDASINTNDPTVFTPISSLGPEGQEKYIDELGGDVFDDFDDFNGLVDSIEIEGSGIFKFWVDVQYLDENFKISTSRQFHKLLNVRVTNTGMMSNYFDNDLEPDTVKMSFIYSYWY